MTETEKREILDALAAGRDELGEALRGVDEREAARTPQSGGWSILGCVEHLAVTEQYLLSRLVAGWRADRSHENREIEAVIRARALDRTRRIECPEQALPRGRCASLNEALSCFDAARAETARFVESFEDDPKWWITDHPLTSRPVNCYEMLLMMALHPARHARQIAEIRSSLERADGLD